MYLDRLELLISQQVAAFDQAPVMLNEFSSTSYTSNEICLDPMVGQSISKTFADKKSCIQFGNTVEKQLRTFNTTKDMSTTVEQVIHKYIDDFSIHRKQSANEIRKWNKIIRDYPWLVRLSLAEITGEHFLRFREKRLKDGSRALNQDLSLFSVMFKKVINVYGFPLQNNPVAHIERAKENTYGRRRIITRREYKVFLESQEPYRLFFLLARNIGARPFSEITNFTSGTYGTYGS